MPQMNPRLEQIAAMARAAGFVATPHEGTVIVSRLGEDVPLAVASPVVGTETGIQVIVPWMMNDTWKQKVVGAFSRKAGEPWREVSIKLSGAAAPPGTDEDDTKQEPTYWLPEGGTFTAAQFAED